MKYIDFFFGDDFRAFGSWYSNDTRFNNLGYTDRSTMSEWEWNFYIGFNGFYYVPQVMPYSVPKSDPPLAAMEEHLIRNAGVIRNIPTISRFGNLDRWTTLTADLTAYIQTSMDEFITGRRSFNQWDAYVQEAKRIGADGAVATVQSWYDNYWRTAGN